VYSLLSEIVKVLLDPLKLALVLVGVALLMRWRQWLPRLRRVLLIGGIAQVWLLSTPLVSVMLLRPLEGRYQRPERPPRSPAAVIVLCGMTREVAQGIDYSAASDRLIEGMALAHRFANTKLVFTGGRYNLGRGEKDPLFEAELLRRMALRMGLPPRRVLAETEATTTRENAVYTARMLRGIAGPKLLVTSARHMPRAVGAFEKAGLAVIPWPVDHLSPELTWNALIPDFSHLSRSHWALYEYFGLLAYKLAGTI
jgi:uncharacterized SAM-binding protein YcdF (DUF218 family)